MKPYYSDESVTLYHGDCMEVLPGLPSGTVHMVCTDPPYVIGATADAALPNEYRETA